MSRQYLIIIMLCTISFIHSAFAGEYVRRSNNDIAKKTNLAIIGTVIKVEDKSTDTVLHQIVTIQLNGVLKGVHKKQTITFSTEGGRKANFHREYTKGDNGVFLLIVADGKFYLVDPIVGFAPFKVKNTKKSTIKK